MCPEEKFHWLVNLLEFPYPRKHFLVFVVAQVVVVTTSMPWIERVKSTKKLPFNTQYIGYSKFSILMLIKINFLALSCTVLPLVKYICCVGAPGTDILKNKHHLENDGVYLLRNDVVQINPSNFSVLDCTIWSFYSFLTVMTPWHDNVF